MADIVIDYELLNQLGKDTDTLKNKVSDARQANHYYPPNEVGADASLGIDWYYQAWKGAFKHAWDLLESLSGTYTTVAQQWFDQDAQYAAVGNEQALGFEHAIWNMHKMEYDSWKKLSETYVTVHGFDDNGNPYEKQVPLADPDKPPADPGAEPTTYTYTASDGSKHTTTNTYDANGNLTGSNTTISDGQGGMSYHENTTFGDNGSYNSTVNHSDGSTTVEEVHGNADGTGTRTDTTTDADGKKTVTVYTGTGVNGADPQWTKKDDSNNGDGNGNNGHGNGNGGPHPTAGSHQQQ
ncbi:hypothetical protein [Actinacidiphila rubida]|uniref:YD repeat-containing protein n=1 Tax=Actinacidiphila rubida TaxID=310780 RepID=A0A1H8LUC0_9ACTN|nr:hypothetical protein [Actinacidiphila rubida]SEO08693.1 YD repeat-containing protein [Actinacidiphila rubida]